VGNIRIALAAAVALTSSAACSNFTGIEDLGVDDAPVEGSDSPISAAADNPEPTQGLTCAYSLGPFGVDEGQVVPVSHNWNGYAAGEGASRIVNVSELYDCDGWKGVDAIIFDTSQYG
jgi:hypothetical protein